MQKFIQISHKFLIYHILVFKLVVIEYETGAAFLHIGNFTETAVSIGIRLYAFLCRRQNNRHADDFVLVFRIVGQNIRQNRSHTAAGAAACREYDKNYLHAVAAAVNLLVDIDEIHADELPADASVLAAALAARNMVFMLQN